MSAGLRQDHTIVLLGILHKTGWESILSRARGPGRTSRAFAKAPALATPPPWPSTPQAPARGFPFHRAPPLFWSGEGVIPLVSRFPDAPRAGRPYPDCTSAFLPPFHVREAVFMVFNVDHPLAPQQPLLFFLRRAGLSARHLEKVVPNCPSCLQNHCRKLLELSDNLFPSASLPLSMSGKRFS
jgi:hypothetical protein